MSSEEPLLISYYGDDFTGSTDALEFLTRAGVKTALFIEPPTTEKLARYPGLRAVGVAGLTRSMTPDAMEAELRPALTALKALGAPLVHYKVCSTFDSSPTVGSIGRVIDVAATIFDGPFVPLLVGAPALGRWCAFGNLFARLGTDGETYRLDRHPSMSRHPITPADESDLRLHLGRQTAKSIALFDLLKVALPAEEARAALDALIADENPEVVLFDLVYAEQLAGIGRLIAGHADAARPLFAVGSSGVEMALGAHWAAAGRARPVESFDDPGAAEPLLAASGSCSPVTSGQIAWAVGHGFAEVELDTAALAAGEDAEGAIARATEETVGKMSAGRGVIVHTSRGEGDARMAATAEALERRGLDRMATGTLSAKLLGGALGRVMRGALERTGARRLLIAGGDTSGYLARALGIEAVEMIAPLTPGAPLCRATAPGSPADGLEVNFKGGQMGREDYFGAVGRGRL
jgi:uncharacterized protein YgbK (DUF1537 family)